MASETAVVTDAVTDALECCDSPDPHVQIVEWNDHETRFQADGYCRECHTSFGGHAELADFEVTR